MRREVLFAGFGGQGIVLAGYVLGRAVAIHENRHAVLMQSYGPEARGGACSASVVIADEAIDYPYVRHADTIVLLSREAAAKFGSQAGPGCTVLFDERLVPEPPTQGDCHGIPATRIAEQAGTRMAANVVMLGFLAGKTDVVGADALREAVLETVPKKFKELNEKAFAEGLAHASRSEVPA
ncbi:MAG: 2-oxoacid:acceptor oxidoreductase family protein [Planctomycetota bacterium]|jgi:2-oxoglutarate ferredoxin oxidoreductase subunit gamma